MDRALLETASVAGSEFTAVDIAAAMSMDLDEIESACEGLARSHRFLRVAGSAELPDSRAARCYAFAHALYQRVVYEGVPDGRRQRLHQRIGEALEVTYGDA